MASLNHHQKDLKELQKTIEAIPRPFYSQHPLMFSWTFWIYRHQTQLFSQNLARFVTARTGEQFFRVLNYINSASNLPLNMGIYIFKENIRPMWEDPANKHGGRLFANNRKNENTEMVWLEILFAMIGYHFDEQNELINGAFVISKNSFNRIGMWLRDASDRNGIIQVGRMIKNITKIEHISFEAHESVPKVAYEVL